MHLVVSLGTKKCSQPACELSREGNLSTKAVKWTLAILPDWVFKVPLLTEGLYLA